MAPIPPPFAPSMAHGVKQILQHRRELERPAPVLRQLLQLRLLRRQGLRLGRGRRLRLQGRLVRRRRGLSVRLADALEHGGELVREDLVEVCLLAGGSRWTD